MLFRLNHIGISGLFLKNIESMYQRTRYSFKCNNGYPVVMQGTKINRFLYADDLALVSFFSEKRVKHKYMEKQKNDN